jgi:tRNA nucleotidyltransferase (CCA-adding enzyme)
VNASHIDPKQIFDSLPADVSELLEKLTASGLKLTLVGGSVRDYLRQGMLGTDLDFEVRHESTDSLLATLDQLADDHGGEKLPFQIKRFAIGNYEVELAPPREEFFEEGNHSHKNFEARIENDLTFEQSFFRRDITINAIGIDYQTKELVDPFNGVADIQAGLIRHCSSSFAKDPVRFLRALRFKVFFGYKIADETHTILSEMNLGQLTEHYFVYESVKSCDLLNYFTLFFEMINQYSIPLNLKLGSLNFLAGFQSEEPLLNLDQFIIFLAEAFEDIDEDQLMRVSETFHFKKKDLLQLRSLVYFLSEFDDLFLEDLKLAVSQDNWSHPVIEIAGELARLLTGLSRHHKVMHFLNPHNLKAFKLLSPLLDLSQGERGKERFLQISAGVEDKSQWPLIKTYCHLKEVLNADS